MMKVRCEELKALSINCELLNLNLILIPAQQFAKQLKLIKMKSKFFFSVLKFIAKKSKELLDPSSHDE